ncbi:dephospho-CoA kinase [Tateyamaria sp. syn59]|uniref:dephospho-CoA kinase n=1 Tax=Tateyamaria sp. syn59 TaxID=2576942 RepID=UPI0011BEB291|nr:dephospho-CoA kinase [Tateyamaria sp. syn59]
MTFKLGLTGSIGMGKSTTAALFTQEGCAVWDADAAVHRLYDVGGAAVAKIRAYFPDAITNGSVSREKLRGIISNDPTALKTIEAIVHPLVVKDREDYLAAVDAEIVVFDIPLLFETGGDRTMDAVAVVHVDAATQRARVLARGSMTEAQFETILAKQMPSAEKCARADFVIKTDTVEHARAQVHSAVQQIRGRLKDA